MAVTKRGLIASATATGIVATGILAYLVAGGGGAGTTGTHFDTSLDASSRPSPPSDWRRGYVRTGTVCYPADATGVTATCSAANVIPTTGDATDTGWPIEAAQNNRFPYNSSSSCDGTPFVCSATASMDSTTIAPDGTATASTMTVDATGSMDATGFGYTASTALDLRMYVKCPNGTFDASHVATAGAIGHWTVDGTALGAGWNLIHSGHAAVTVVESMTSDASGFFTPRLSGISCAIWGITATEVASTWHHNTIPTSDATGSSIGAPVWSVDNTTGAYWAASGVTKTETLSEYAGTCWNYSGTTIKLTGSSTCTATWYALSLKWTY